MRRFVTPTTKFIGRAFTGVLKYLEYKYFFFFMILWNETFWRGEK